MNVIGLDIGTAWARAAVLRDGQPVLLPGAAGTNAIPAAVSIDGNRVRVGTAALRRAATQPQNTVRSVKAVLGNAQVELEGRSWSPPRILASLIRELRDRAHGLYGQRPDAAVLCAPLWFRPEQREALAAGATQLGLEVLRVIAEPAAVAMSAARGGTEERRIAVVDVGASGLSAAVLIASAAGARLVGGSSAENAGGDAVDSTLAAHVDGELRRICGRGLEDGAMKELLRQACEAAKQDLGAMQSTTLVLPWLPPVMTLGEVVSLPLDQAILTSALAPLLERLEHCWQEAMGEADVARGQLDALYLSGGMARLGAVRGRVEQLVGRSCSAGLHPDGAVALGAASQAAELAKSRMLVVPTPLIPAGGQAGAGPKRVPRTRIDSKRFAVAVMVGDHPRRSRPPEGSAPLDSVQSDHSASAAPEAGPTVDGAGAERARVAARTAAACPGAAAAAPSGPARGAGSEPRDGAGGSLSSRLAEAHRALARPAKPARSGPRAMLDRGTIVNPRDAVGIVGLALARGLTPEDLEPVALAVLFTRLLSRQATNGTLTVEHGERRVVLDVIGGVGRLSDRERGDLRKAFEWPTASYSFDDSRPAPAGRARVSLVSLAAEGVRARLRSMNTDQLEAGLGERLDMAPMVIEERDDIIARLGLDRREKRFIENTLEPTTSGRDAAASGGIARATALQVLVLLTAFGCVQYRSVAAKKGESLAETLDRRASAMQRSNHFDVLGVHWSALEKQIDGAYRELSAKLERSGPWDQANPDACRAMRERLDRAHEVLSDSKKRADHRAEQYADIDTAALADLMQRRGQALELKGAERELAETMSKRTELAAMRTRQDELKRSNRPHNPFLPGNRPAARRPQQQPAKPSDCAEEPRPRGVAKRDGPDRRDRD